jgi:tetratricopeptide (TPR) repeat protein
MTRRLFSLTVSATLALVLAACSSPKIARVDAELKRTAALADAAYGSADWTQAAAHYTRTLARARQMDQPADIAAQAYALAACRVNLGQWDQAADLLEEAAAEARRAGADPFDIRLLRAKVALWQGRNAEARGLAADLLPAAAGKTGPEAQIRILLGQLACDAGDLPRARAELEAARALIRRLDNPGIRADWESLRAGVALLEGKPAEAAAAYDEAARQLQAGARYPEMAVMLDRAGAAFAKAGDKPNALDRSFRAARSFAADGDTARAKTALARAQALAGDPRDQALARRLDALRAELDAAPKTGKE